MNVKFKDLAEYYGVTPKTIGTWRKTRPRIFAAIKKDYVENKLKEMKDQSC